MAKDQDDSDLIAKAKKVFTKSQDAEAENRERAKGDIVFSRASQQWPDDIAEQRQREGRPCLTLNKCSGFIRQVVNDARQNKPQIKVHAVDDNADKATAEVIAGLMRNIERESKSDLAYDNAVEQATSGGFGYMRVSVDYTAEDIFDEDIVIEPVVNQFSVYGDPDSTSADGSDWNNCFVVDRYTKEEFEAEWGEASQVDWDSADWQKDEWRNDDGVLVAEWWTREDVKDKIYQLSNGIVVDGEGIQDPDIVTLIETGDLQVEREREVVRKKVIQRIMTGAEILSETEWRGRYIPIVPVYGEEFWIEGKRYLKSLIHDGKDAQAMHNFWRTTSTELVALAPRTPWVGPKNFHKANPNGWATANTKSHPFLEYDGQIAPTRQPLDSGSAAGALQEALMAHDDMKSIMGIHDASLGAKSNETSGRAIMARQREGDTSTFHFIDNLSRSIRQLGKIVIDLIPHVYDTPRIVRVLGDDGTETPVQINQKYKKQVDQQEAIIAMHDLTAGKYDLTVSTGPSFTTKREEAGYQMTEFVRAFPAAAPVMGDLIAKNSDWPDADEVRERLESLLPSNLQDGIPQEALMAIEQGKAAMAELQMLKQDKALEWFRAETDRMKAQAEIDKKEAETVKTEVQTAEILETPIPQ